MISLPPLDVHGVDDDDIDHAPSRELVRQARLDQSKKRPDMVLQKIDVLARSDDMSVTATFMPTRDLNRREAVRWLRDFTLELKEAGFEPKDVARSYGATFAPKKVKPPKEQWLKKDGTPLMCGCGQGTYLAGTGNVVCMDRSANLAYKGKHAFVPGDKINA